MLHHCVYFQCIVRSTRSCDWAVTIESFKPCIYLHIWASLKQIEPINSSVVLNEFTTFQQKEVMGCGSLKRSCALAGNDALTNSTVKTKWIINLCVCVRVCSTNDFRAQNSLVLTAIQSRSSSHSDSAASPLVSRLCRDKWRSGHLPFSAENVTVLHSTPKTQHQ